MAAFAESHDRLNGLFFARRVRAKSEKQILTGSGRGSETNRLESGRGVGNKLGQDLGGVRNIFGKGQRRISGTGWAQQRQSSIGRSPCSAGRTGSWSGRWSGSQSLVPRARPGVRLDFVLGRWIMHRESTNGLAEGPSRVAIALCDDSAVVSLGINHKQTQREGASNEMSKIKVLFGVTVMVGLLAAITASSASALFSSTTGSAKGQGKAKTTTFTDVGASVSCESAVGSWKLTKGKGASEVSQVKGAENVDLHVNALHGSPAGWEKCKNNSALGTLEEVSECELQVTQTVKGQTKALGTVLKGCVVTVSGCKVNVPKSTGNENLKEVLGKNLNSTELLSEVKVVGIESEAVGALCELGGIKPLKNKSGEEKGEVTGVGLQQE
jgi:hypothetical protein